MTTAQDVLNKVNEFRASFISDFGKSFNAINSDGSKIYIPRYAVWGDLGRGKPEVKETSDSVPALQKKYGPDLEVVKVK